MSDVKQLLEDVARDSRHPPMGSSSPDCKRRPRALDGRRWLPRARQGALLGVILAYAFLASAGTDASAHRPAQCYMVTADGGLTGYPAIARQETPGPHPTA
jgi:hypothetical protein